MNDRYDRSWPGEEPGHGRPTPQGRQGGGQQWPSDDDQWDTPQAQSPQWPGGGEQPPARRPQQRQPDWPGGEEPPRRGGGAPRGPRNAPPPPPQGAPPGGWPQEDRQPAPPPAQHGGGYRPPPANQPPLPPRRQARPEPPGGVVMPSMSPDEREPELITHHEHNGTTDPGRNDGYGESWPEEDQQARFHEFGAEDDDEPAGRGGVATLEKVDKKKKRWRIVRRTLYVLIGLAVVVPTGVFTYLYYTVDFPTPQEVAAQQNKVVTYFFADGSEMGKDIPEHGNRELLEPNTIPLNVKRAIYATEDSTFETNSGFDITGILRAVYNQATGGVGGGSTISQQYIKKATANEDGTLVRKANELVQSFKMNQDYDKEQIITAYLNTIYFGRGAYGIQTAAQAFFGVDAKDLKTEQAALLAGLIQQPGRAEKPEVRADRWKTAMDRIVQNGWMTQAERDRAVLPEVRPLSEARQQQTFSGPNALLKERIKEELAEKGKLDEGTIQSGGYKIYTTVDPKAQELAIKTVDEVMKGQPEDLKEALVAVDPKTGGVIAYYGGPYSKEDQRDWANTPRPPGSSFKPFDLVALLQMNKGLGEVYDGSSPQTIQGAVVRNSEGVNCSQQCTVAEAMERSVNTVFYDFVAKQTGVKKVAQAAQDAGISATFADADNNLSIGGGRDAEVTPRDMAAAYATFANNGIRYDQHFVKEVKNNRDEVVYNGQGDGRPVFTDNDAERSKMIAGNVTRSLVPVLPYSKLTCPAGYECAGKTGTHQYTPKKGERDSLGNENSQAWMVGYSPAVSVSSWVGTEADKVIKMAGGKRIYGKDLPGEMWRSFMTEYLKGKPKEKFDDVKLIGRQIPVAPPSQPSRPSDTPSDPPSSPPPSGSTDPSDPNGDPSGSPSSSRNLPWPGNGNNPPGHGNPANGIREGEN